VKNIFKRNISILLSVVILAVSVAVTTSAPKSEHHKAAPVIPNEKVYESKKEDILVLEEDAFTSEDAEDKEEVALEEEKTTSDTQFIPLNSNKTEDIEASETEQIIPFKEEITQSAVCPGIITRRSKSTIEILTEDVAQVNKFNSLPSDFKTNVETQFYNAALQNAQSIDISSYKIAPSDEKRDEIYAFFQSILDKYPELYHVKTFSLSYLTGAYQSYYTQLKIKYYFDATEYSMMNEKIEASIENNFGDILDDDSLTDLETALLVHDKLALICEYDEENYALYEEYMEKAYASSSQTEFEYWYNLAEAAIPSTDYTMYGSLVLGTSVCQGYATAYKYILGFAGIESVLCPSYSMVHVWNQVKIDGEYYHVDVTWDDPVEDVYGQVRHDNFMRSSSGIYSTGHTATDYDTTPKDITYDDYFWQDSYAAFQLLGGEIYYINSKQGNYSTGYGVICEWDNEASTTFHKIGGVWGNYAHSFSSLGTYNGKLYYSTSDKIYSLTQSGTLARVYELSPEAEPSNLVYGFKIVGDSAYVELKTDGYVSPEIIESFPLVGNPIFSLNLSSVSAKIGDEITLTVENFNANYTAAKVGDAVWESSNNTVATVDTSGKVVAVGKGQTTISCKILDTTVYCNISVLGKGDVCFDETTIIVNPIPDKTYTGKEITPSIAVLHQGTGLRYGEDFTISYENNVNVGTATAIITGKGVYVGEIRMDFAILPYDITSGLSVALQNQLSGMKLTYSGSAIKPNVKIKPEGIDFVKGVDYTLTYENNVNVGTATIVVKGMGNFRGTAKGEFAICRKSISSATVSGIVDKSYCGSALSQSVRVVLEGKALSPSSYKVTYSNNKVPGRATVKITGVGNYTSTITKYFYIHPKKVSGLKVSSATKSSITIKWSKSPYSSGYAILRATSKGGAYKTLKLLKGSSTLKYTDKHSVSAGKTYYYKVVAYKTVGGKKYTSVASNVLKAASAPKAPSITKLSNKSGKKVYIKWSKVSRASGYKVYMSTKKSSGYKCIYTGTKTSYTKKGLKKGKTYYFKVRAYKKLDGKSIYSSYSSRKYKKITK